MKISWRRKQQPTPVFLPGKFHGQRSLVAYSPWDRTELDTTEQIHFVLMSIFSASQVPFPLLYDTTQSRGNSPFLILYQIPNIIPNKYLPGPTSEKAMATHSSTLAWRLPGMGAWWAAIYGVSQSRT